MDKDGELGRIAKEEDGSIVKHPIPVTLLRVELERKTTRVTGAVWRTLLTTDGGEAGNQLGLLANAQEHVDRSLSQTLLGQEQMEDSNVQTYNVTDVVRDLEFSVCSSTLCVDNTLRDPFPVEVCKQVDQMEVLEQERSVGANPQGGFRVHDLWDGQHTVYILCIERI